MNDHYHPMTVVAAAEGNCDELKSSGPVRMFPVKADEKYAASIHVCYSYHYSWVANLR